MGDQATDADEASAETAAQATLHRIGLALSGGGIRAAVFHLGVLRRLASEHLLENVSMVSTVSGVASSQRPSSPRAA